MDYKNIAKKGVWVYVVSMLMLPVSFLLRVLFARNLSIADYGNFYSIISMLSLMDVIRFLGVNYHTCSFFINKYSTKKQYGKLKGFFYFAFSIVLSMSFIISSLVLLFSGLISDVIFDNVGHIEQMLPWMVGFWFFSGILQIASFFLVSYSEQTKAQFSQLVHLIIALGLFLGLGVFLDSYLASVQAYFYSMLMGSLIALFFFFRNSGFFLKAKAFFSVRMIKRILNFSWNMIFLAFMGTILSHIDVFFLQIFQDSSQVAFYNVSFPTANFILILLFPLSLIIAPLFARLWHEKDKANLKKLTSFFMDNFLAPILPIVIFLVMFSKTAIFYIFGGQYIDAHLSLELFSFFFIFKGINMIITPMIIAMGKPQKASKVLFFGLIVNTLLDLILVPLYSYMGATFSTGIAQILMTILLLRQLKKMQPFVFSISQNVRVVLSAIVFFVSVLFMKSLIPFASFKSEFMVILAGAGVFLAGFALYFLLLMVTKVITKDKVHLIKSFFKG